MADFDMTFIYDKALSRLTLFIVIKKECWLSQRFSMTHQQKAFVNRNERSEILTNDTQVNEMAHVWRRRYLT